MNSDAGIFIFMYLPLGSMRERRRLMVLKSTQGHFFILISSSADLSKTFFCYCVIIIMSLSKKKNADVQRALFKKRNEKKKVPRLSVSDTKREKLTKSY